MNIHRLCAEAGETHREQVASVCEIADPEATHDVTHYPGRNVAPEMRTIAPGTALSVASSTLPVTAVVCSWTIAVRAATAEWYESHSVIRLTTWR